MIPKYDLCTCARCEFIFRKSELVEPQCPQCGFPGFYGARQIYGAKAYRFEKTQTPWMERQMAKRVGELTKQIEEWNKKKRTGRVLLREGQTFKSSMLVFPEALSR